MKTLRLIIVNTTILQMMIATLSCFVQWRICTDKTPIQLQTYGLCKNIEPKYCLGLFMLFQVLGNARITLCGLTLYYKYKSLQRQNDVDIKLGLHYILFLIPAFTSLTMGSYIFVRDTSSEEDQLYIQIENSNLEYDNYRVFGQMRLSLWPNIINNICMSVSVYVTSFVTLYYRRKILRTIQSNIVEVSPKYALQTASLVRGLTIQSIIPLVFHFPTMVMFHYSHITKKGSTGGQLLSPIINLFPMMFDPVIHLYYIVPSRKKIIACFSKKKTIATVSVTTVKYSLN